MEQNDRTRRVQKAEALYDAKLRAKLEPAYTGQFVAIDPDTEEYFLGRSLREACLSGAGKHSEHKWVCLRVGFPATRFIGHTA